MPVFRYPNLEVTSKQLAYVIVSYLPECGISNLIVFM